jgi:hypothetical protein
MLWVKAWALVHVQATASAAMILRLFILKDVSFVPFRAPS